MKSLPQIRSDRNTNNTFPQHESSPAPFLPMEQPVKQSIALLLLFSKRMGDRWEGLNSIEEAGAVGLRNIACDCAAELLQHWNGAHEEARTESKELKLLNCPCASMLVQQVHRTAVLLDLMAAALTDYEEESRISAALGRHEEPEPADPSGYLVLAHRVTDCLKQKFNAAFDQWQYLEATIKQRATA